MEAAVCITTRWYLQRRLRHEEVAVAVVEANGAAAAASRFKLLVDVHEVFPLLLNHFLHATSDGGSSARERGGGGEVGAPCTPPPDR
jgi:hypothetical protein